MAVLLLRAGYNTALVMAGVTLLGHSLRNDRDGVGLAAGGGLVLLGAALAFAYETSLESLWRTWQAR